MTDSQSTEPTIYQLKITLNGSKSPIWRRVQVRKSITLAKLHRVIQIVMGWQDYHLHQFIIDGVYYGIPDPDFDEPPIRSEKSVKLERVVPGAKTRFVYEYDFGDSWLHGIVVEQVLSPEEGTHYPCCMTGKRAAPPEDCGGIYGFYEFLAAIQDPEHPEHEEMLEWTGGSFDPETFDIESINRQLKRLR